MIPQKFTINTEKYHLRIPDKSDFDFIFSASRFPHFNDGMQWEPPQNKDELIRPLQNSLDGWNQGIAYSFTILSHDKPQVRLGRTSIRQAQGLNHWNVGFWVHPNHQGQGIMTEVLKSLVDFGFSKLGASEITAECAIWNKPSEKVLLKNGFKFRQHIEKGFKKNGKWVPENQFILNHPSARNENSTSSSCHFCSRIAGNKNTIFENERFAVMLDIDPISLGHVIICPKRHFTNFHDMTDDLRNEMMDVANRYIKVLDRYLGPPGYSMMLNGGVFNDLQHCHLHVFPRNTKEEFQWTYSEEKLSKDASKFDVLKKLFEGSFD